MVRVMYISGAFLALFGFLNFYPLMWVGFILVAMGKLVSLEKSHDDENMHHH